MEKKIRRQCYIVYHSATRSVWKHLFFMRKEQALETVMRFYGHGIAWKRKGRDSISCPQHYTFTVMTIKEFTTIGDVEYSATTKWIKGQDHP